MKYLEVFDKAFLLKKTEILNTDSNFKKNQKYVIKFLFETGLRASELLSIISYDKKTLLLKGKGNKIRQIFHNYETTSKITNLNITTKTLRIWVKNILGVK
jgi:integrase/recombinase XerD